MEQFLGLLSQKTNRCIEAFNAGDYPAAGRNLEVFLDLTRGREVDLDPALAFFKPLRKLAAMIGATQSMNGIDAILQRFMGEGLAQFASERDREIRSRANDCVAAFNAGDMGGAKAALRAFLAADPAYAQIDCIDGLAELTRRLGDQTLLSDFQDVQFRLKAQQVVTDSNREMMPSIDHNAIDYPNVVTIETFMKCNARCGFCPYPTMADQSARAGVRMSEDLFAKIIDDLTDIPRGVPFQMNLSRVNEPFLDRRIFDFMDLIAEKLPQVPLFMPSNASTLNAANLKKLAVRKRFRKLMVSLNACDKEEYESLMGLPFERTLANLDLAHEMMRAGEIDFFVVLTAVKREGPDYDRFVAWCEARYPLFSTGRYPPTNWFGTTDNPTEPMISGPAGCKDWYQVHILADGTEAQCCFDSEGKLGAGNVRDTHILDLYNKDWQRRLRRMGPGRQSELAPEFCRGCDYA